MCNALQQRLIEERLVEEEVYEAMIRMRHRISEVLGMHVTYLGDDIPQNMPVNASGETGQAPARRRPPRGRSAEWDFVYGDGKVPEPKSYDSPVGTEVMAVGDMERDPNRPIAPYIPPTDPKNDENPFPMLNGPMG